MASRTRHRSRIRPRGGEGGYSLIETMFAMTFLAIGLLAVAQMIPLASSHLTSARAYTGAQERAASMLEELKALPYTDAALVAGEHTLNEDGRTITWTVADDVPVQGTKRVDLSVSWSESEGTKTLEYTTLLNR